MASRWKRVACFVRICRREVVCELRIVAEVCRDRLRRGEEGQLSIRVQPRTYAFQKKGAYGVGNGLFM